MPRYSVNRFPKVNKKEVEITVGNNVKQIGREKCDKELDCYDDIELFMQQKSVKRRLEVCDSLSYQDLIQLSYDLNSLFPPSTLRCDPFLSTKKRELEDKIYTLNKEMYSSKYGKDEFKRFMNN